LKILIFLSAILLFVLLIIIPGPSRPIPDFSANITNGSEPLTVSFTDLSLNKPTGWLWYFGDEDFSGKWIEINPSAGWIPRYRDSSVVMPDGRIVIMGGSAYSGGTAFQVILPSLTMYGSRKMLV
jgi:hypothetical protein